MRLMPRSLRMRLLLLSLLVILPALMLLAWQLSHAFEKSVEARVRGELENHLNQLIAHTRALPGGGVRVRGRLSDPRFRAPLSGLYWQINNDGKPLMRSRSLWDTALAITPAMLTRSGVHEYTLLGPRGGHLYALMRGVWLEPARGEAGDGGAGGQARRYYFTVALDHGEITTAVDALNRQLYAGLAALALILAAALGVQIVWGLMPIGRLRRQLESVRAGKRQSLSAPGISELKPLVSELNALLKAQEKTISEARARAANLAHGMKTPLAVLSARARDLRQRGLEEEAADIDDQIRQLGRHIEHELARSKIHGRKGAVKHVTNARKPLEGIVNALRPMNPAVQWRLEAAAEAQAPMEQGDFMELAGNLLENAAKWARGLVRVRFYQDVKGRWCLVVEDDGPGVPEDKYGAILARGARLDERVRGNGLGLAIVSDILASYGYVLRFFPAVTGGLGACVIFAPETGESDSAPRPTGSSPGSPVRPG